MQYEPGWEKTSRGICAVLRRAETGPLSDTDRAVLQTDGLPMVRRLRESRPQQYETYELQFTARCAFAHIVNEGPVQEELASLESTMEALATGSRQCSRREIEHARQHFSVFHHYVDGLIR